MSECQCPRCRLGYIPSSYTFGGRIPPQGAESLGDAVAKIQKKYAREIADVTRAAEAKMPTGISLREIVRGR